MIKPILGTRPGDPVTKYTPVGSVVRLTGYELDPKFTGETRLVIFEHLGKWKYKAIETKHGYFLYVTHFVHCAAERDYIITPGPLPWHHRAWNWLAERIGK